MARLTGNTEHFTFQVADVDERLRVYEFHGQEFMSDLYSYQITIACDNSQLDFAAFIGKQAVLTLIGDDEEPHRHVNGIINRIQQGEEGARYTNYYLELVPSIWLLNYQFNCRIFQNKNVVQIIEEVLGGNDSIHIPYDISAVEGEMPVREYCVQYRESDLNFISRLMEKEGIFYFFEHNEEEHKIIFGNHPAIHYAIDEGELSYVPPSGAVPQTDAVYPFHYSEEVRPGKVKLKDYNFKTPAVSLLGESSAELNRELVVYDYPGEYLDDEQSVRHATLQQQQWQVMRKFGTGRSDCLRMVPGYVFTLADHPRGLFNNTYVLTRVVHSAVQPQVLEETASGQGTKYENEFDCIPLEVPYRPDFKARKPFMQGAQTAVVVGPSGEEIYTDQYGRIKVQFHWDLLGEKNENSSCFVRVSQMWAGAGWGAFVLPRIGMEVVVDFLEGDPDQPLVTGCVYHETNSPPYPLPDEKTKTTLKSNTTTGGGGSNEIRFEDKAGSEEVYLHAQKDMNTKVENNQSDSVGANQAITVGGNKTENVEGTSTQTIKGDTTINVDEGHYKMHVKTGTSFTQVKGAVSEIYEDAHETWVDGSQLNEVKGGIDIKSTEDSILIEAATQIKLKVGDNTLEINSDGSVSLNGVDVAINGTGSVNIAAPSITSEAEATQMVKAQVLTCDGTATNTVKGGMVLLNP